MLKNKFTEIETIIEITKITSITSFPPSLQLSIKLLVALCARGKMEKFDFLLNCNFANYNAYIQKAKLLPETTVNSPENWRRKCKNQTDTFLT